MKPLEFLIQDSRNIMMSLQITKLSKKYFINFLIIRYTVIGMGVLNPELLGHFINIQVYQQLFFFFKKKNPKRIPPIQFSMCFTLPACILQLSSQLTAHPIFLLPVICVLFKVILVQPFQLPPQNCPLALTCKNFNQKNIRWLIKQREKDKSRHSGRKSRFVDL